MATRKKPETGIVDIPSPNFVEIALSIKGTAPYVQNRFSERAGQALMDMFTLPAAEKKGRKDREPRNFERDYEQAQHRAVGGWHGIPAGAFRSAMIDACRTVRLEMTRAKLAVMVIADGVDAKDGTPLVRLISAKGPERTEMRVRNDGGSPDIRIRPRWNEWRCDLRVQFDADMLTASSVANLLERAGRQVGVGEGRPFSKSSHGMGWGTFAVVSKPTTRARKGEPTTEAVPA